MKKTLSLAVFSLVLALFVSPTFAVTLKPSEEHKAALKAEPVTVDRTNINNAVNEFNNLSKQEKKQRLKDAKKALKDYKNSAKHADTNTSTALLVILAILLPPVAVLVHEGELNNKFWIDLLLTLLFYLPGLIYALIVVLGKH